MLTITYTQTMQCSLNNQGDSDERIDTAKFLQCFQSPEYRLAHKKLVHLTTGHEDPEASRGITLHLL
jgi:hypothetical protein